MLGSKFSTIFNEFHKNSITGDGLDYFCMVCDLQIKNVKSAKSHIISSDHSAKFKETYTRNYELFKYNNTLKVPYGYYCIICDILLFTKAKFMQHTKNVDHTKQREVEVERFEIQRYENSVIVNEFLITEDSWNSICDGSCSVCEIQPAGPEDKYHTTSKSHVLKIIQTPVQIIEGNIMREIENEIAHCMICNTIVKSTEFRDHIKTEGHKILSTQSQNARIVVYEKEKTADSLSALDKILQENELLVKLSGEIFCTLCNDYVNEHKLKEHLDQYNHKNVLKCKTDVESLIEKDNKNQEDIDTQFPAKTDHVEACNTLKQIQSETVKQIEIKENQLVKQKQAEKVDETKIIIQPITGEQETADKYEELTQTEPLKPKAKVELETTQTPVIQSEIKEEQANITIPQTSSEIKGDQGDQIHIQNQPDLNPNLEPLEKPKSSMKQSLKKDQTETTNQQLSMKPISDQIQAQIKSWPGVELNQAKNPIQSYFNQNQKEIDKKRPFNQSQHFSQQLNSKVEQIQTKTAVQSTAEQKVKESDEKLHEKQHLNTKITCPENSPTVCSDEIIGETLTQKQRKKVTGKKVTVDNNIFISQDSIKVKQIATPFDNIILDEELKIKEKRTISQSQTHLIELPVSESTDAEFKVDTIPHENLASIQPANDKLSENKREKTKKQKPHITEEKIKKKLKDKKKTENLNMPEKNIEETETQKPKKKSTFTEDMKRYSNENNITFSNTDKGYCRPCKMEIPKYWPTILKHINQTQHKTLHRNSRLQVGFTRILMNHYIDTITQFQNLFGRYVVLNDEICIGYLSFLLIVRDETLKCHACKVDISPFSLDWHIKEKKHQQAMISKRIIAVPSEFIRELDDDVYHCGVCNITVSPESEIDNHLLSQLHKSNRTQYDWVYKEYSPEIRTHMKQHLEFMAMMKKCYDTALY